MTSSVETYAPAQLYRLEKNIQQTQEQMITGDKAHSLSQMGTDAWYLLGLEMENADAQHLSQACQQHRAFLGGYQNNLKQIETTLAGFSKSIILQSSLHDVFSTYDAFKESARGWAEHMMHLLNTHSQGVGYIFGGAQTDIPPVDPALLPLLCAQNGPEIAASDIPSYFSGTADPSDQLPFVLYSDQASGGSLTLPLQAQDMADVFVVLHDILSWKSSSGTLQQDLMALQSSLDPAFLRVKDAILSTTDLLNSFSSMNSEAVESLEMTVNEKDVLLSADPIQTSLDLLGETRAFEAFLDMVAMNNRILDRMDQILKNA